MTGEHRVVIIIISIIIISIIIIIIIIIIITFAIAGGLDVRVHMSVVSYMTVSN